MNQVQLIRLVEATAVLYGQREAIRAGVMPSDLDGYEWAVKWTSPLPRLRKPLVIGDVPGLRTRPGPRSTVQVVATPKR